MLQFANLCFKICALYDHGMPKTNIIVIAISFCIGRITILLLDEINASTETANKFIIVPFRVIVTSAILQCKLKSIHPSPVRQK